MNTEQLIEVYQDTKKACAGIPVPNSEKIKHENITGIPFYTKKRGNIIVIGKDTVSTLSYYSTNKTAVLNMCNPDKKGGGAESGRVAQEEGLFRCSNLFTIQDEFYPLAEDEFIYTHGATFIKSRNYEPINQVKADVITMAAPNLNTQYKNNVVSEHTINNYESIMLGKINAMFDIAQLNRCNNLILGAWGCGVFRNDPTIVSKLFLKVLLKKNHYFENIVFAIINDLNSVGNNYQIFFDTLIKNIK